MVGGETGMKETITKCYCDRCRQEMPERHTVDFKAGCRTFQIKRLTNEWKPIDLCDDCIISFGIWLDMKN